jgi:hypothetical protein
VRTTKEDGALRELLLATTARAGRSTRERKVEGLLASARVSELPALADFHRVSGSVLRGLEGIDGVPDEVRSSLRRTRDTSGLQHMLHVGLLAELAGALDADGIDWLVMKGPMVAATLYPAIGDRTYGDLDLLVRRRDYARAMAILEGLGFVHAIHNWALTEEMLNGQVSMSRGGLTVDLHWHLHYSRQDRRPFKLVPEAMIERRRTLGLSGVRAPVFDSEDNLLALAFHAGRSDGHRLVWFKDIERAIVVDPPDFDELVRRSLETGCAPTVGLMLRRSRDLLGADVPPEVITSLAPRTLALADRLVCRVDHPIRFDDSPSLARAFTRSLRSSTATTIADVPTRAARWARLRVRPPRENETDDPAEKARFLHAVATASE